MGDKTLSIKDMKTGATRYIRSERARNYLNNSPDGGNINGTAYISINRAANAAKMAEEDMRDQTRQDARERAVKTYCKMSILCGTQTTCREGMRCRGVLEFLEAYDNEA